MEIFQGLYLGGLFLVYIHDPHRNFFQSGGLSRGQASVTRDHDHLPFGVPAYQRRFQNPHFLDVLHQLLELARIHRLRQFDPSTISSTAICNCAASFVGMCFSLF